MSLTRRRFFRALGYAALAGGAWLTTRSLLRSAVKPKYPLSDHFDGRRFFNPNGSTPRGVGALLKWQTGRKSGPWPTWVELTAKPALPPTLDGREAAVTWVNHATFLLQLPGVNILIDPVWSERVSPVRFAGPKRVHAPGIPFDKLPRIDVVLVSHNHYDHMDLATLKRLQSVHRPRFVTTLGNQSFLEKEGLQQVAEIDWWQTQELPGDLKITATPAQHFAARGLGDRFETLWAGFVIEAPAGRIYFAGDSGYFDGFRQIGERLGPFDLSFIPIGAYEPRWVMEPVHCTPKDALQIHREVRSRHSLAMHFGCFPLADDGYDQPVRDLEAARGASGVPAEEFVVPVPGETRRYRFA